MSDLNSHRSAGNSLAVADRSMSVPSTTVAPCASSVAIASFRIGSTTGAVRSLYVGTGPNRQTPIRLPARACASRNCV